jgi:flagella basal body P-ring formation protein FlgA
MRTTSFLIALLIALVGAARASADTVALRGSARVAPGAPVTLADIAELEGAEAKRLAAVEIARGTDAAFSLEVAAIRAKLVAAGAKDGSLRFRGDRVVVRPARAAVEPTETAAPQPVARPTAAVKAEVVEASSHAGDGTPLGIVCELLCNAFGDDAAALRLHIAPKDLARLAPKAGLRYEVSAQSSLKSDFVSFEIVALDGDRTASRERVRVSVRVAREVAVAVLPSRRGKTLGAGLYTIEERELPPSIAASAANPHEIDGAVLARSVDTGAVVAADDIVRAATIRRNDRILVRREVGLVAIEMEAIALEDGRIGDRIAVQRTGGARTASARSTRDPKDRASNEQRTFTAEVVGNGRVVIR